MHETATDATAPAANDAATDISADDGAATRSRPETIVDIFWRHVHGTPARTALRRRLGDAWEPLSWRWYGQQVRAAAAGLLALGIQRGDRAALLSTNRAEWHVADLATLSAGAVTVTVYPTSAPSQVAYVVGHAEARVCFVEDDEQLAKVLDHRDELPKLERIVVFEGDVPIDDPLLMSFDELVALGIQWDRRESSALDARTAGVQLDDLATFVYTSGTTGPPKGVMITHGNMVATIHSITRVVTIGPEDRFISFLPLSHVAERVVSHFGQIVAGGETWFARSMATIADDLKDCRPTVFFGVPRVWEKVREGVEARVAEASGPRGALARRFLALAPAHAVEEQGGERMPYPDAVQFAALRRLVGPKLLEELGFDKARILVSGAAPIHPDLLRWLHGIGLPVAEVYGQTEDCGPTSLNPPERIKIGSVGPPIPGVRVRIADDGEILVHGANVCVGYYHDPEGTAALLDDDGWMHSGDVGHLDADGYLHVTDRKKDLIITAHGKNISPQEMETSLTLAPVLAHAVVVGDGRPYLTALLTLEPEVAAAVAGPTGPIVGVEALAADPLVREAVAEAVEAVNRKHARVENIRKWRILPHDLTIADGELTPTLKVRRKAVNDRYAEIIDAMYAEA